MKSNNSIVINSTVTTVGPLSIKMPVAQGGMENRYGNFPLFTIGSREVQGRDGERYMDKEQTGYLPSTTVRGFLRRAVVTDAMERAAEAGNPYTLQKAYADLIGQDAASEKSERIDLVAARKLREDNAVIDLFGCGISMASRLLVSHFMPAGSAVLPEFVSVVRKDLEDTEGVLEALSSTDRNAYFSRGDSNSRRADAAGLVADLKRKVKAAVKKGEDVKGLEAQLKEAEALVAKFEGEMGDMQNSSRTLAGYYALPPGTVLTSKIIIERPRDRDLPMIELALDALSQRPLLGAQVARGCGEIAGSFDVMQGGVLLKKITIGGFAPATVVDFSAAENLKQSA
jgi:hypothetical protein